MIIDNVRCSNGILLKDLLQELANQEADKPDPIEYAKSIVKLFRDKDEKGKYTNFSDVELLVYIFDFLSLKDTFSQKRENGSCKVCGMKVTKENPSFGNKEIGFVCQRCIDMN